MARDLQTKNFIRNNRVRTLLIYKVKESVGKSTRCVDCDQSLIFPGKITLRVTHVVTSLSAIMLAEIRTGRTVNSLRYMKSHIRSSLPVAEN